MSSRFPNAAGFPLGSARAARALPGILWATLLMSATAFAQDDCCAPKEDPHTADATGSKRVLRVTSDPNNLPFSNEKREGFENKLADLIAKELGAELRYSWRAQRRGFFRETLKEDRADL